MGACDRRPERTDDTACQSPDRVWDPQCERGMTHPKGSFAGQEGQGGRGGWGGVGGVGCCWSVDLVFTRFDISQTASFLPFVPGSAAPQA